MNVVFCDKRDCLFWDVDGICNSVMPDGIPYCKSEGIDAKKDAADGLREENAKMRELVRDMHKAFFSLDIDHCQACPRDSINGPCTKFMVFGSGECSIEEDMLELGIVEE